MSLCKKIKYMQRNRIYKEESKGKFRTDKLSEFTILKITEYTITEKIKKHETSLSGFKSRIEMTKEGVSELEVRPVETTQSEQEKEKRLEKMNKVLGICGTTTKCLNYSKSQQNWKKVMVLKEYSKK